MHELSIAMNIIEIAEDEMKRAGAKQITGLEIEIGTLSGVETETLMFSMDVAKKDTVLADAEIIIHTITGLAKCTNCQHEYEASDYITQCPECKGIRVDFIRGKELKISKIHVI